MAVPIVPRMHRGRLYFKVADVLFLSFAEAAAAWFAAEAQRVDILDTGGAA